MTARARKSSLIVPATSERMLVKAREMPADEIVIDLEDAVPPAEKTEATRNRVAAAILENDWCALTIAVRVNAIGTPWFDDDVNQLVRAAGQAIDCLILPKVESGDHVVAVSHRVRARLRSLQARRARDRGCVSSDRDSMDDVNINFRDSAMGP